MTVRYPLYLNAPPGEPQQQFIQMTQSELNTVNAFAPYAFAQNPNPYIEVNTANGTLLANQPFVDTYYIAGAGTTDTRNFDTEAETPNISMVTDNYSRIREVRAAVSLPSGDANNLQYPLYLYDPVGNGVDADFQLRTMSITDFIDTFVMPALSVIQANGTQGLSEGGTYFMTTTLTPTNATVVSSVPAAVNSTANVSAYTSGGIPEAVKQTIDVNYYIAKVNHPATSYAVYDSESGTYDLPLYFDAGTETIRSHNPTTWSNLLNPFLRYYMAYDADKKLNYFVDGAQGSTAGSIYTDTRVTPTGTGYTTRYVNTNDYRTQEFPTGTASIIAANTKTFKIFQGTPSVSSNSVNLQGTSGAPQSFVGEFPYFSGGAWSTDNGFWFDANGNVYKFSVENGNTLIFSSSQWFNGTVSGGPYYIRVGNDATGSPYQVNINNGSAAGTWHALTSDRKFSWTGTQAFGAYGTRLTQIKVEIADDAAGANIIGTGYYRCVWEGGA